MVAFSFVKIWQNPAWFEEHRPHSTAHDESRNGEIHRGKHRNNEGIDDSGDTTAPDNKKLSSVACQGRRMSSSRSVLGILLARWTSTDKVATAMLFYFIFRDHIQPLNCITTCIAKLHGFLNFEIRVDYQTKVI